MKLLQNTLVLGLLVCASCITTITSTYLAHAKADSSLIQFFVEQGKINESIDPETTAECFNIYLPLLSQTALNFSTKYEACIKLSDHLTTNLTSEAAQNRAAFVEATTKMCQSFQYCGNETDIVASINCYSDVAGEFIAPLYTISTSAAYAATILTHGLRKIQEDRDLCTNSSEQYYVTETAATYEHLSSCLQNGMPVTKVPSTSSAATEEVSTTETAVTPLVDNTLADIVVQCSNGSGIHIQTSDNRFQTQSETGSACQSQSSAVGSQSHNQAGSGTQSQCSGSHCGEYKPFSPLFPMLSM